MSEINKKRMGSGMVIITTFPTLFTPLRTQRYIEVQVINSAINNAGLIPPMSFMDCDLLSTC